MIREEKVSAHNFENRLLRGVRHNQERKPGADLVIVFWVFFSAVNLSVCENGSEIS